MLVNGGTARISGTLNLLLGENSWGGINVDTTHGDAGVIFEDGSQVNAAGEGQNVIYVDEEDRNNGNTVTITGAEEAGLAQDADGNYITADAEEDPEQPEDPIRATARQRMAALRMRTAVRRMKIRRAAETMRTEKIPQMTVPGMIRIRKTAGKAERQERRRPEMTQEHRMPRLPH